MVPGLVEGVMNNLVWDHSLLEFGNGSRRYECKIGMGIQ